jgi:hypothetical protein
MSCFDFLDEFQTIFSRQSDVHKDKVREEAIDFLQRFAALCRLVNRYFGK